jgi:hypothetical protein
MIEGLSTMPLEDVIRLRVFLAERIDPNTVMFQELLNLHG